MVGIDADAVSLQVKCVLTVLDILQFIFVQVWPAPDASINYVWKPFSCGNLREYIKHRHSQEPSSDLKSAIQSPGDSDTLGVLRPACGDGCDQTVQLVSLLFQFLYQGLYCSLAECLALSPLAV